MRGKSYCESHAGEERTRGWLPDAKRGTRHERGYGADWEKRREHVLYRDNGLCQPCLREGRCTPATAVDHVKEKADGGTDDDDNLQAICDPCHKAKTARELARRRKLRLL